MHREAGFAWRIIPVQLLEQLRMFWGRKDSAAPLVNLEHAQGQHGNWFGLFPFLSIQDLLLRVDSDVKPILTLPNPEFRAYPSPKDPIRRR